SLIAAIRSPLRRPVGSIPSSPASWRSSARTMPESPPRRRGVPLASAAPAVDFSGSCWLVEGVPLAASLLNSSVLLTNVLPDRTTSPTWPSGLPVRLSCSKRTSGVCYQPLCRSDSTRGRETTDFGNGSGNQQHRAVGDTRLAWFTCDAFTPIHTCRCTPCCRLVPEIPHSNEPRTDPPCSRTGHPLGKPRVHRPTPQYVEGPPLDLRSPFDISDAEAEVPEQLH